MKRARRRRRVCIGLPFSGEGNRKCSLVVSCCTVGGSTLGGGMTFGCFQVIFWTIFMFLILLVIFVPLQKVFEG